MIVKQIYTGCLAQGAYYIESNGKAAIIDPLREVHPYLEIAKENKTSIQYIFETHFHADFVSGHLTLAEQTGAEIIYGPNAKTHFKCTVAQDLQEFQLGDVKIRVLHTPGHTLESSSFLLMDEAGKEHAIFTGDTLFLGDVGRPDLAQKSDTTQEDLAGMLFDSLRTKIMTLPKDVIIYPGHGAGSACGKNMSKETKGILSEQLAHNYALRIDMTREEFIKEVTDGLEAPPAYFPLNVKLNKEGYPNVQTLIQKGKHQIEVSELAPIVQNTGAIILDTRHQDAFAKAHIPKSIFIGIEGGFAPWVGALIQDVNQPIVLVTDSGKEEEVITRLSRVGFDHVIGIVKGGVNSWTKAGLETDDVDEISAIQLKEIIPQKNTHIFDVRKSSEHQSEHIQNAKHTPLANLNHYLNDYKNTANNYIHCAGGYRSMIAISILKSRGIHHVVNIKGGFKAMKEAGINTSDFVCPSTL